MKRELFIINSLLLAGPFAGQAKEMAKPESPNILFILSDDQGWSQVSKAMHPDVPGSFSPYLDTPNLNRLGDAGMRFTSGYAPAPLCTPTRRSILCGVSAARGGTEFKSPYVPAENMTIPKALKLANPAYITAHFGKWGGETMTNTPEQCGYDASDGVTGNPDGGMPTSFGYAGHNDGPPHFIDNQNPKLTESVTQSAIDFMRQAVDKDRPFYVQVSYYAVHLSVVCKEETLGKYKQKGEPDRGYTQAWCAMLDDMDQGVGKLLEFLEEMKISENTLVVFMSDNGGSETIPDKNPDKPTLNSPLTGGKQSLYEGGIRVPFMVRGPGIVPGTYSHIPVSGYDLLPTFYFFAGGKSRLPGSIDGGSLLPLFSNPSRGVVKRPLNALTFHRPGTLTSAIRQGPYKLFITWDENGKLESRNLYNLDTDIVERNHTDIAATNKKKADRLEKMLLRYLKAVNAKDPLTIVEDLAGNQTRARPLPSFE